MAGGPPGGSGSARRRPGVAQAVVELLSRDNAERKALMSLLGTWVDPEHRAQRWAETHPCPGLKREMMQLRLWEEQG